MIEAAKIGFVGEAPGPAEFLERQGFSVKRTPAPVHGASDDPRRRFDLLLVRTAHVTGETLALCARSARPEAAPCVLIVSDAADEEERIRALEAGAADCLAEPLSRTGRLIPCPRACVGSSRKHYLNCSSPDERTV